MQKLAAVSVYLSSGLLWRLPPWLSVEKPLRTRCAAAIGAMAALALCVGCGTGSGSVSPTNNPQVALYTFQPHSMGTVTVEFGPTTSYGFKTSAYPIQAANAPVRIFVAGMRANTTYHMRAVAKYQNGTTAIDSDHTFTTGSYDPSTLPQFTATTATGQAPQPGVEMVDELGIGLSVVPLVATDLSGNIIWAYVPPTALPQGVFVQAPKMLPNGDILMAIGANSADPISNPSALTVQTPNLIREIDLAGDTVKEISMADINQKLTAANYHVQLLTLHHDVTVLPNGHWLVLGNTLKNIVLTGQTTPTQVLGDVIVDLDTNLNPVWVWNEFDHLDVNRHPWNFPDWTHTNAIVYSKDDGNILVSMRHQNWVVKVDYNNGAGTGNILWRLGPDGDFTLQGGTNPTDWFYAQHGPSFTTPNTTGIFGLTLMDNGNDRLSPVEFAAQVDPAEPVDATCGTSGAPACYSTVPIFQINEVTKTATLIFHQVLSPNLFNNFGGNAEVLANGDVEYDLCGLPAPPSNHSQISEVTDNAANPQTVWTLQINGASVYRGYRMPSLYPGVQW